MHQVPEKSRFGAIYLIQVIESFRIMVHCGALAPTVPSAATYGAQTTPAAAQQPISEHPLSGQKRLKEDYLGNHRSLIRSSPTSLNSFQVLGEIYEDLTPEDLHIQIVPGIA